VASAGCRDLVADVEDPYVRVVGKGDVTRDCPLPPEVVLAVEAYLAGRRARTGRRPRPDEPVWLNNHGDPLTPAALDHYVRRWFARAGVPLPRGAQAHAFRHTVAMQLVGRGEALNVVRCSGMRRCDRPRSTFEPQVTTSARLPMVSLFVANSEAWPRVHTGMRRAEPS
jgi:integrase